VAGKRRTRPFVGDIIDGVEALLAEISSDGSTPPRPRSLGPCSPADIDDVSLILTAARLV